jgi:hypothetical protein
MSQQAQLYVETGKLPGPETEMSPFEQLVMKNVDNNEKLQLIVETSICFGENLAQILKMKIPYLQAKCINLLPQQKFDYVINYCQQLLSAECVKELSSEKLILWIENAKQITIANLKIPEIFIELNKSVILFEYMISKGLLSIATDDKHCFLEQYLIHYATTRKTPYIKELSRIVRFILFFTNDYTGNLDILNRCDKDTCIAFAEFFANKSKMLAIENACIRQLGQQVKN